MALKSIAEAMSDALAGNAQPALDRFIAATLEKHLRGAAGSPEDDDALVAAVALVSLLKTPDGRRLLCLKRRPRGSDFKVGDYIDHLPAVEIAIALRDGEITEKAAVDGLFTVVGTAVVNPNPKQIKNLLMGLVARVVEMQAIAQFMVANEGAEKRIFGESDNPEHSEGKK